MKCGTSKKKKLTKKEEDIEQAIATLEKCLSEFKVDETQRLKVWSELETKKRELEAIIEYRTKGVILRSDNCGCIHMYHTQSSHTPMHAFSFLSLPIIIQGGWEYLVKPSYMYSRKGVVKNVALP